MKIISIKSSMTEVMEVTFVIARSFEALELLPVVLLNQKVNFSKLLPSFVAADID